MKTQDYLKNCFIEKNDIEHAKQVEKLAVMFFQKLYMIFENDLKDLKKHKKLLEIAALLHDIGTSFSTNVPHNKIGAKFVMENKIDGLNEVENLIVANLIRYHRGKKPKEKHKLFNELDKDSKWLVLVFSSILRIADALDYNHFSLVDDIEIDFLSEKRKVLLHTKPNIPYSAGFERTLTKKKQLFEEVFKINIELSRNPDKLDAKS